MDDPSWRTIMKENMKATWPGLVVIMIIFILFIINISIVYQLEQASEQYPLFHTINGSIMGVFFITTGFHYRYYKEHYQHIAVKYAKPQYEQILKIANVYIIFGMAMLIFWIVQFYVFS